MVEGSDADIQSIKFLLLCFQETSGLTINYTKSDACIHMRVAKNLWDALEVKFGVTDTGSELCAMEQFHDYRNG